MELKAKLTKPYTDNERSHFIVINNHSLSYEIRETDDEIQAWGPDASELLASAKESRINYLKSVRDEKELDNISTDKGTFDFDEISQNRIRNAIAITTDARNWTLANGNIVSVTVEDLQKVLEMGAKRSDLLHNRYLELKAAINKCTTIEAVTAIKWNTTL